MKKIKYVVIILLTIVSVACNKSDDDGGDNPQGGEGTFTASIGGTNFSGSVAANATESNANGVTIITMLASDADGKAINIIINPFDGPGTYDISDDSVFTTASYTEADVNNPMNSMIWVAPYANSGMVGQINVSEKTDASIKGTFNFEGKLQNGDSLKNITNGAFNLSF